MYIYIYIYYFLAQFTRARPGQLASKRLVECR